MKNIQVSRLGLWSFIAILISLTLVIQFLFSVGYTFQIDHWGHISSAAQFSRGMYHEWSGSFFRGYIHGLFYPPLEDFILSFLYLFLKANQAYAFYLVLIAAATHLIVFQIAREHFKTTLSRTLWIIGFLLFYWMDKKDLMTFQGMGVTDFLVTGLSSQSLGTPFFLLFISEIHKSQTCPLRVTVWFTLILLSHLILTLVSGVFLVLHLIQKIKERPMQGGRLFYSLLIAALLTSFYWGPFLINKSSIAETTILWYSHLNLFLLGLSFLLFVRHRTSTSFILFLWLLILNGLEFLYSENPPVYLPKIHYYRFYAPLALIALFLLAKSYGPQKFHLKKDGPLLFLAILFLTQLHPMPLPLDSSHEEVHILDQAPALPSPSFGKTWVIEPKRACDFSVETFLTLHQPQRSVVKGLYWESSAGNTLLSSYLTTLLSPPSVLNYFYYFGISCAHLTCFADAFLDTYGISEVWIPRPFQYEKSDQEKNECLYQALIHRSHPHPENITIGGRHYEVLKIKNPSPWVDGVSIKRIEANASHIPNDELHMQRVYDTCSENTKTKILVSYEDYLTMTRFQNPIAEPAQILSESPFPVDLRNPVQIHTPEDQFRIWRIKIQDLPGIKISDSQNQPLPKFSSIEGILTIAKGKITLIYEKPFAIKVCEWVSLLTLVCVVFQWILRRFNIPFKLRLKN